MSKLLAFGRCDNAQTTFDYSVPGFSIVITYVTNIQWHWLARPEDPSPEETETAEGPWLQRMRLEQERRRAAVRDACAAAGPTARWGAAGGGAATAGPSRISWLTWITGSDCAETQRWVRHHPLFFVTGFSPFIRTGWVLHFDETLFKFGWNFESGGKRILSGITVSAVAPNNFGCIIVLCLGRWPLSPHKGSSTFCAKGHKVSFFEFLCSRLHRINPKKTRESYNRNLTLAKMLNVFREKNIFTFTFVRHPFER